MSIFTGFFTILSVAIYLAPAQASSISDSYSDGDTLTSTMMTNVKSAVNDNDTRITGLENSGSHNIEVFPINACADTFTADTTAAFHLNVGLYTKLSDTSVLQVVYNDNLRSNDNATICTVQVRISGSPSDSSPLLGASLTNQSSTTQWISATGFFQEKYRVVTM